MIQLKKHQKMKRKDLEIGYFDEEIRDNRRHARWRLKNEPLTDDLIHDLLLAQLHEKTDKFKKDGHTGLRLKVRTERAKWHILHNQEYHLESYLANPA